jgi:tetratricopeptide (TPR) repeat protein
MSSNPTANRRKQTRAEHVLLGYLLLVIMVHGNPPWGARSIAELDADPPLAPVVETAEPDASVPLPLSPNRVALQRLLEDEALSGDEPDWIMPEQRRIAGFGDYREIDEASLEERVEFSRLQVVLRASEEELRRGRPDAAMNQLIDFLKTVRFDESRMRALQRLGIIAFRQQDYALAADYMQAALEIEPNNPALSSNLAAAQMTLGRLDDALDTLNAIQTGLIRSPSLLFSIHFNLACLYSMKNESEQALDHLYQAAESDAPSVLASLGDPQLDGVRDHRRFRELQIALDRALRRR